MIVLISGLINLETTLQVDGFPLPYFPVRYPFFGVNSRVSGVGYNLAKALTVLGDDIRFLSLVGKDPAGQLVTSALQGDQIPEGGVLSKLSNTPQSVILYEPSGRRQIHVDLKNIQEQTYPLEGFEAALAEADLAVLCNINFSRPFLTLARRAGKPVATDVHAIADLEDEYNRDFMTAANILFLSDERLPVSPEEWVRQIWNRYGAEVVVVGMGAQGAVLGVRREGSVERYPAITTRPVVNTIGAGDALFSAFLHEFNRSKDPHLALEKAQLFASYKIGTASASDGFLAGPQLDQLFRYHQNGQTASSF